MQIPKKTSKLAKIELPTVIFLLVIASVFVPMLVSAASTVLNIVGISLVVFFFVWLFNALKRSINNNHFN